MNTAPLIPLVLVAALAAGCGSDDEPEPRGASKTDTWTTVVADNLGKDSPDAYALEKSGGVREGCSESARGEGGQVPGCIYAAAFAGCTKGLTGEHLSQTPYKEEFPEAELRAVYERAVRDCRRG